MVGDNDAGGVLDVRAGRPGLRLFAALDAAPTHPVLIVTRRWSCAWCGHRGRLRELISERFGRFWGWYSTVGIFLLNFLTISTEFMGISLAGEYFGLSPVLVCHSRL